MIINAFPTPIFSFKLEEEKQNKKFYMDCLYKLRETDKGTDRSNINSWHSSQNNHILKQKEFKELKDFILSSVKSMIDSMGYDKIKLSLTESWSIITPKGGYNSKHHHAGSFISGSYYINSPSAPIIFYDPRPVKPFTDPRGMTNNTMYNSTTININPKEGDLILFPSWLEHSVAENRTDNDRVIISFNLVCVK